MRAPLLLVCLITLAGAAYIPKDVRKKPGKCPHVGDITNSQCPLPPGVQNIAAFNEFLMSIAECLFDGDCKGADKCCFDGCKTKCTSVTQWKRDEFHAGKCPPVNISRVSSCKYLDDSLMHYECSRDTDCRKNEKCCFDGCLVECVEVSRHPTKKPGKCPSVSFTDRQKCADTSTLGGTSANEIPQDSSHCKNDDDCNGTEKCCSDGCNLKCHPALFLKESDITAENKERRKGEPNTTVTTMQKDTPKVQHEEVALGGEKFTVNAVQNSPETVRQAANLTLELERTFVLIKPDGVRRGLISDILGRFERKGYKLVAMKLLQVWISTSFGSVPRGVAKEAQRLLYPPYIWLVRRLMTFFMAFWLPLSANLCYASS